MRWWNCVFSVFYFLGFYSILRLWIGLLDGCNIEVAEGVSFKSLNRAIEG